LVVDDDADSAECLAAILSVNRNDVVIALSAAEALATVEDFTPDVAIIDIGLPGETGIQLAAALRALPQLN
jgi:CheY-like chemotaxis protein